MTEVCELINVNDGFRKGKRGLMVVEKFRDDEGVLDKRVTFDPDPNFFFYHSVEPREVYNTSVPLEEVEKISCKYSKLHETIAKVTGRENEYEAAMNSGKGAFKKLNKLNFNPNLHQSDVNIIDFTIRKYNESNAKRIEVLPLWKSYFDIEVDTMYHEGFPKPDEAPCPINFISYVNKPLKKLMVFVLLNPENESMMSFIEKNKGSSKSVWTEENNDWCRNAVTEHFSNPDKPSHNMEHVTIHWFKHEVNLIKQFYKHVHEDRPDFLGGWNTYFDVKTIEQRLIQHGVAPESVMCPEDFPIKKVSLREDMYSADLADKSDTLDIMGWGHTVDLQYFYASIRKGRGKQESLKLGDILLEELGETKYEYEGTIQDAVYVNFEKFLLYSCNDSYRLMQLEDKNSDIDLIHMMSNLTFTRHAKVMRKTVSIRNLAAAHFWSKGLVLSNNQNSFIEHEDYGKFKGAFVADAQKVLPVGVEFNGERSTTVFEDTVDEDFTGLYPAIISAFQVGDMTLIGKLICDDQLVNDEFGELMNERDLIISGNKLFGLPTLSELLENLDEFVV